MVDETVASILADPLAPARAAGQAIGYAGLDVPEDLLTASGRLACHLPWDADRPTPAADRWLESSFAPWTRSVLEDWANGRFDFLECVIFSRGDDSAQRLYYYICELQRQGQIGGPEPLVFDLARIPRATSLAHTIAAVRKLAARLGIDDAALRRGIGLANQRRRWLAALDASRQAPGSHYERIARASLFAPLPEAAVAPSTLAAPARGRVLLAGSMPPDDRLHRAVEAAGWSVMGEAGDLSLLRLGPEIADAVDDPAVAIGRHAWSSSVGSRAFVDRATALTAEARRIRADAVILWLIEEDEAPAWHVPAQRAALGAADLSCLVMTRRRWDAADGAADEIGAWLRSLER